MRSTSDTARPASRRRLTVGAAATALAMAATAFAGTPAQAADPVTIDLVTVNDFHGRIEAASPSGGIAALATAVNEIRAGNPHTVFAAAGDMIGASTFTSFIQDDEPTIDTLNDAGLDVSAVGNHEFDKGWADLRDRVQPLANWEYLASNVFLEGTDTPALPEYHVETLGGIAIGFIGAVTDELPSLVSPAGIADLEVRDVTDNVNRVADQLSDGDAANGEADVVVLLVHEGASAPTEAAATDPDSPFGDIVLGVDDDVDAIVSGHTHLAYNLVIDGRPVISSGQYGEKFSNMKIVVDPDTKQIISMTNTIHDMWTVPAPPATSPPPTPNFADDPAVAAKVADAVEIADVAGSVQLGTITADVNRGLQPGLDSNGDPALVENRGAESTLGNFVADAQLWSAQRADAATQIAFMNPGGLRADMTYAPDGILTYKEAAVVQPFANTLVTVTLTGDQVRQALEQQWQPSTASRPFLKLGVSKGLSYTFDPTAAAGSRITTITLDGAPIQPAAAYRVVVNSFLASGGDNFPAFAAGTDKRDTGKVDLESMVEYMADRGTASPDPAQRAVGVTLPAPPSASGYPVGGTIALRLSSLDFTTNEPAAGRVKVSIAGKSVGSARVDRSLTTADDLTGTAALSVVVPRGVSGTVPLTVTAPSTGTSVTVPITVHAQAKSTTVGVPSRLLAKKGAKISYSVVVIAKGHAPTGEVTIRDGSKAIATATLTTADKGRITVKLPALSRGPHKLSASYAGSDLVAPSKSRTLPVLIR